MTDRYRSFLDLTAGFGPTLGPFVCRYLDTWRSYKPGWVYEDGCAWKAAIDLSQASGHRFAFDFAYREISARIDAEGRIAGYEPDEFNIDNVNPGRAVLLLADATGEARFVAAIGHMLGQLLRHPRTQSGNFWHKRIYPNQVWLDGLYMAQPLRTAWAVRTGDDATLVDVLRQFDVVWTHLRDQQTGMLCHGWDESRAERWADPVTGQSPHVWSRALGWYLMALADCIEPLQTGHSDHAAHLGRMFAQTAEAMLPIRSQSGLWYQLSALPEEPGNYEETSASLMIAYALMKGARLGVLDSTAGQAGADAFESCVTRYVEPDRLRSICGVAGLGGTPYRDGSIAYYLSEPIVDNDPKGVAALMLALAERLHRG